MEDSHGYDSFLQHLHPRLTPEDQGFHRSSAEKPANPVYQK
jgi:hypothetical protein